MYKTGAILFLTACSPLHPGASVGVGAIDLPIQREESTKWPIIQGGGLKGAMRDRCGNGSDVDILFGPWDNPDHAGALGISEADLVLFPVRSLKGGYAHVTCRLALKRLRRSLRALESVCWSLPALPLGCSFSLEVLLDLSVSTDTEVRIPHSSEPIFKSPLIIEYNDTTGPQKKIILEEDGFDVAEDEKLYYLAQWLTTMVPEVDGLERHLLLASDDIFTDFVRHSTDVITRNRIDESTGVVVEGALWTEERLPRETVLYSTIFAAPSLNTEKPMNETDILTKLKSYMPNDSFMWVGGNTTVGSGLAAYRFS